MQDIQKGVRAMGQVENIMLADWWWGEAEYGVPLEDVRIPTREMLRRGREVCEEEEKEADDDAV